MITAVDGTPRHLAGWLAPQPHHRLMASRFATWLNKTPQDKGFAVPGLADNYQFLPRVFDQGALGDCGPHAGVTMIMATRKKFGLPDVEFSRLDLYARIRKNIMRIALTEDSGVTNTDLMMALMQLGVCEESIWPSINPEIAFSTDPTEAADENAAKHKASNCYSLTSLDWLKANLGLGFVAVAGFAVPEHFATDTARTGQLRMPEQGERFSGGHDIVWYGCDDTWDNGDGTIGAGVCRNSWSDGFGLRDREWNGRKRPGDFMMPYGYILSWLAQDVWACHWSMKGF